MKVSKIILVFILTGLLATGCSLSLSTGSSQSGGGGTSTNDGGVYKSVNKGTSWLQKVLIPTTSGRARSIATLDVLSMAIDPSDNKAIYIGTLLNGLFFTYDGADDWQVASTLGKLSIRALAVDPAVKCIIYASADNKVYKSDDCSRTWSQVYFDNDLKVTINTIAVDNYNSNNVYIGTSRGEIIKSSDKGISWQTLQRFDDDVERIQINQKDTRVIFVGTTGKGVHRSLDTGRSWVDLTEKLKEFKDSTKFRDLVLAQSDSNLIFLATSYGLLKSSDNGNNWSKIELITPEKEATINSLAVNPKNANEIYYVTNTTFYRSLDGGQNWTSKRLPTSTRAGSKLLIDFSNPEIIYLGAKSIKK